MNVPIKKLWTVVAEIKRMELSLKRDVWNGKPPFRFIEINRTVGGHAYF